MGEWENSFANHVADEGFVSRKYKELLQLNNKKTGDSLVVVQWLGLHTFTALAWVPSLVGELRSHKPCGQKANKQTKQTIKRKITQYKNWQRIWIEVSLKKICK